MSSINCQQCNTDFSLTDKDRELLDMLSMPNPTFCPQCRFIRRFSFRNERALSRRPCDLCKKEFIMMYPEDVPFPVYCKQCWWSDDWSSKDFASDYDFNKPFFTQFQELLNVVPRPGNIHQGNIVNSDYTNRVSDMRNCYLVFGASNSEYCRYSNWTNGSKSCQDCHAAIKSESCYDCTDCTKCYNLNFSAESTNCRDSNFLHNCVNTSDSLACVNLRNAQYCVFNEQLTKEGYRQALAEANLGSARGLADFKKKFEDFKKKFIVPALVTRRSINSSGNWLEDCKDTTNSFNCQNSENSRNCFSVFDIKDSLDCNEWSATGERLYETVNVGIQVSNVHFAHENWNQVIDAEYIMNCHSSKNLFGCIGIRNGQYFILNKEYSKEDFEAMIEKIKNHMAEMPYVDAKGRQYRYGEFFPTEISPHKYNETLANEYYPRTKEEALEQGYTWRDIESKDYKITLPCNEIPDSIKETDDLVLAKIIGCEHEGDCKHMCTTAFKVIPEELEMYRQKNIPLPKICPNCRYYDRLSRRNPFKLWERDCQCAGTTAEGGEYSNTAPHTHGDQPCQNKFETSYSPDREEKVYCIECYQQEVA